MSSADFGMTSQARSAAQKETAWENFTLLGPFLYALAVLEGATVYPLGNTQVEIEVVVVVDMVVVVGIVAPEESMYKCQSKSTDIASPYYVRIIFGFLTSTHCPGMSSSCNSSCRGLPSFL